MQAIPRSFECESLGTSENHEPRRRMETLTTTVECDFRKTAFTKMCIAHAHRNAIWQQLVVVPGNWSNAIQSPIRISAKIECTIHPTAQHRFAELFCPIFSHRKRVVLFETCLFRSGANWWPILVPCTTHDRTDDCNNFRNHFLSLLWHRSDDRLTSSIINCVQLPVALKIDERLVSHCRFHSREMEDAMHQTYRNR